MDLSFSLVCVAELRLCLQWEAGNPSQGFPAQYDPFRVSDGGGSETTCTIRVLPAPPGGNEGPGEGDRAFLASRYWAVYPRDGGWRFVHRTLSSGRWQRALDWSPAAGQARLWLEPDLSPSNPLGDLTLPFFTALFARHQGLLLHAAAIEVDGRAWVFAGPGGSGKSHWARRWQERGMAVLDEDRLVLRRLDDGQVWAFGTPWHAEPRLCSPRGAPVGRLFSLRQADPDAVREVRPAAAAALLVRSAKLPLWDPEGMQAVLDVAGQAAAQSRSFLLGLMTGDGLIDRLATL